MYFVKSRAKIENHTELRQTAPETHKHTTLPTPKRTTFGRDVGRGYGPPWGRVPQECT